MESKIRKAGPGADRRIKTLLFSIVFALPIGAGADWTDVSPPDGAVAGYAVDPNTPATLFATNGDTAGTGKGVWKSTDSGASWGAMAVNDSAEFDGAAVKPGDSNVVVAGIQGAGGIERSINGGSVWASESTGDSNTWVFGFSISTPAVVFAGGSDDALGEDGLMLKSTDSGDTWVPQSIASDATPNVLAVAVDPTNADIVYAGVKPDGGGFTNGLYKTTDGGATWTLITTGPGNPVFTDVDTLAIDPNNSSIIYAGTSNNDEIWRSIDGGTTWTELLDPSATFLALNFFFRGIAIDPDDSRVIYAAGGDAMGGAQVIASSDCGVSWTDVSATGITGVTGDVSIDTTNNFVYVLENILSGRLYREVLGNGLPAASGACPGATTTGGGSGGGGGGGSSLDHFMIVVLGLLGIFRLFKSKSSNLA